MITIHINATGGRAVPHELVDRALREVLRGDGVAAAELSVTFVGDTEIARLHDHHLGSPRVTDVISFALHGEGEAPLGDVYIGHEQALRQAADAGVAPDEELARLAVHGALHVLGYDHPEGSDRADSQMFAVQEEVVRRAVGS
ncbi:MAG: rRNA maturation RNase YbeY [Gemmatimonadetes bacterium]|nr:rRNA maturation RNase YbeY [Gemmatimonadota bacterium]